ncbi:hypothetical protein F7725_020644 [Dissostichus mawsoni]|uniref:G-protein coupled receptors family 3 profile domain-containing protein n=1 Tax=Dissostichus mawsoni TaxID=36200 RepID=A0A7J5YDS0_DISMA|nr:hypothetical protein F7725_020644 [Dissostichus mawsoni]
MLQMSPGLRQVIWQLRGTQESDRDSGLHHQKTKITGLREFLLQVVKHLQSVNFTIHSGERVYFDRNGDPAATYELVNWQRNPQEILFLWLEGATMHHYQMKSNSAECSPCPLEYWSNEDHSQCVPKVIEFLSYGETMGALLTAFSLFGAILTLVVLCVFFRFRHTPLVKASNSELSFLLLFSLTLCFLCSLTFIGQPTVLSCMLRHTAFGITFALCMSCILAKTIAVVMAFKATRPTNTLPQCSAVLQRTNVLSCTLLQMCVLYSLHML